jgi:hypothetical protein
MPKVNPINLSNKLSQLELLITHPVNTFNFIWVSADTFDDLNYYNKSLVELLKLNKKLFYFYIDYSHRSRLSIINKYLDIINQVLNYNRTLSAEKYEQLKNELIRICKETNYFKLYINDNLQKIQISYNVIYENYKYEHQNFNAHLSNILKWLAEFYPVCLIIENSHQADQHNIIFLSSLLLSKPNITIVFTFSNNMLDSSKSIKELYSILKENHLITKQINLASLDYYDLLEYLKLVPSLSHLQARSYASLIIKKCKRSIPVFNYFIQNIEELDSFAIASNANISIESLVIYLLNKVSIETKKCLLLACLEGSPFNLQEICRYYGYNYQKIKDDALKNKLISEEVPIEHTSIIREGYFQFISYSSSRIILENCDPKVLLDLHHEHWNYCIKRKKVINAQTAQFIAENTKNDQLFKNVSKDFFSQLLLEAYACVHLESYSKAHDYFCIILTNLDEFIQHSKSLHFDVAYHYLLSKLYSSHTNLDKEWQQCFDLATHRKERALLHLFKMKWYHQKQFSYNSLIFEAKNVLRYFKTSLGFVPRNKALQLIKYSSEVFRFFINKDKLSKILKKDASNDYSELLIISHVFNLLITTGPYNTTNLLLFIRERVIDNFKRNSNAPNVFTISKNMIKGNINKLETCFEQESKIKELSDSEFTYSLPQFIKTLFFVPLKYNLRQANQEIESFLSNKITISPNNSHYWLACINFQHNFQLFNGNVLSEIKQNYDLNVYFLKKSCRQTCKFSSSAMLDHTNFHKFLLDECLSDKPFNYIKVIEDKKEVLESNEAAEPILKFLLMFVVFFKHDYKSSVEIAKKIEDKLNNFLTGVFYPLFCFYYSVSLFMEYKKTSEKDPSALQLIQKHMSVFSHLIDQNLSHYKSYYLILNSIQNNYFYCKRYHKIILEAIEEASKNNQLLVKLVAHEIAAIYYAEMHDSDGISRHIGICINAYKDREYIYKSNSLKKHYEFQCNYKNESTPVIDSTENIIYLLNTKKNKPDNYLSNITYMIEFVFQFVGFEVGYFVQKEVHDLQLSYEFLNNTLKFKKNNVSFDILPKFIQTQCNYVLFSETLIYECDLQYNSSFSSQPYVVENKLQAILVVPIISPELSIKGVFYFETKKETNSVSAEKLKELVRYMHLFESMIVSKNLLNSSLQDSANAMKLEPLLMDNQNKGGFKSAEKISSEYFVELKSQLISISKLIYEKGVVENEKSPSSLSSLINYVVTMIQSECRRRKIIIDTHLDDTEKIVIDFNNIILMFLCVLLYCIENTENESRFSLVTTKETCGNESFVVVALDVTLTKKTTKELFESFEWQANNEEDANRALTLFLVQEIMALHQGNICLNASQDHDFGIAFIFPLIEVNQDNKNLGLKKSNSLKRSV